MYFIFPIFIWWIRVVSQELGEHQHDFGVVRSQSQSLRCGCLCGWPAANAAQGIHFMLIGKHKQFRSWILLLEVLNRFELLFRELCLYYFDEGIELLVRPGLSGILLRGSTQVLAEQRASAKQQQEPKLHG